MRNHNRLFAYLALLANSFLWALAIPFAKRGFADGLTPTSFLFSRFLFALILSFPIITLIRNRQSVAKVLAQKVLLKVILIELIGTFAALWLLYEGVSRTSVVEAALISVTWPIFVTIGGVWFLKEKENKFEIMGLVLAVAGSILIAIKPGFTGTDSKSLVGNILILTQNFVIASYYLLAKKHYQGLNKWVTTHISFWVGAAAFALVILARGSSPALELTFLFTNSSFWPLVASLYMATFGSIFALTLYLIGQDRIEASEASLFTYLQPVFTVPIAIIFFGETVGLLELGGITLITLGIIWAQLHSNKG